MKTCGKPCCAVCDREGWCDYCATVGPAKCTRLAGHAGQCNHGTPADNHKDQPA